MPNTKEGDDDRKLFDGARASRDAMVDAVAFAMFWSVTQPNLGPFGELHGAERAWREKWNGGEVEARPSYLRAAEVAIEAMKPFMDRPLQEDLVIQSNVEGYERGWRLAEAEYRRPEPANRRRW